MTEADRDMRERSWCNQLLFRQKTRALFLADAPTLIGTTAIDAALDIEQRVDASVRLQRNRRDLHCVVAAPGIGRDVGQFEELPPGMSPAPCRGDAPAPRAGS